MYIVTLKRTASYPSMTFGFDEYECATFGFDDYECATRFMKTAMIAFRRDEQIEDDGIVVSVKLDEDA